MKATRIWQTPAAKKTALKNRFKIIPFVNPTTGSKSWRVTGSKRDGTRIRENFSDVDVAHARANELQTEWLGQQTDTSLRATKLSETALRLAELAILRLGDEQELLPAIEHWLKKGKSEAAPASCPTIDEAATQYLKWLESTDSLRPVTKPAMRLRVLMFRDGVKNVRLSEVTPEFVEGWLARQNVSATSKDNYKRAVSRFFSWCIERPRRWINSNPCALVRIEKGEKEAPAVLTLDECQKLLTAAEGHNDGKMVPFLVVSLFAGLRPAEAARLSWSAVNLPEGELRLEGNQTKTGKPRVVTLCKTAVEWLRAYQGADFKFSRREFDYIKNAAGFGGRANPEEKLKPWVPDVLRHTAISHHFRRCGSHGESAEKFGNSEAIIKRFYQARVSSNDTKAFYALRPTKKGGAK